MSRGLPRAFRWSHMADGTPASRTVLLVDDQPDIVGALSVFLRYSIRHLEVRTAHSAAEAMDVLKREPVDLVVADYHMPVMDGLRFLEAVGRMAPGVPRILFTGHWDEAALQAGASRVAERLLPKSAKLEELADGVHRLLEQTPPRGAAHGGEGPQGEKGPDVSGLGRETI